MSDNGLQEQKGKDIFDNADYVGFHRYLSELAFINQLYSMMTRIVWMSLANDYVVQESFHNQFKIF